MDLASLKRVCSKYTSEIVSKEKEIERQNRLIEDIREQIAVLNNDTDAISRAVQDKKQRYQTLKTKC